MPRNYANFRNYDDAGGRRDRERHDDVRWCPLDRIDQNQRVVVANRGLDGRARGVQKRGVRLVVLVPAALETSPEMLSLALFAAGRPDVARALSLPRCPLEAKPDDKEEGRSFEVTELRIKQIEATALRKLRVADGRELSPDGEDLMHSTGPTAQVQRQAAQEQPTLPSDASADWFPARSLWNDSAKPRFWLIAQLGRVLCVRKGVEKRVAEKLASGWSRLDNELEVALVHHEVVLDDLGRDIRRRAASALLASGAWRSPLAAQALVRALGTSDVAKRG